MALSGAIIAKTRPPALWLAKGSWAALVVRCRMRPGYKVDGPNFFRIQAGLLRQSRTA